MIDFCKVQLEASVVSDPESVRFVPIDGRIDVVEDVHLRDHVEVEPRDHPGLFPWKLRLGLDPAAHEEIAEADSDGLDARENPAPPPGSAADHNSLPGKFGPADLLPFQQGPPSHGCCSADFGWKWTDRPGIWTVLGTRICRRGPTPEPGQLLDFQMGWVAMNMQNCHHNLIDDEAMHLGERSPLVPGLPL